MVFAGDFTDDGFPGDDNADAANDPANRIQALRAASCIKLLGKGVIRVVHRVDDAKENNQLGKQLTHLATAE